MWVAESTVEAMRILVVGGLVGLLMGCATTQPFVLSESQRTQFAEAVRQAEAAGANDGSYEAHSLLANAKSDFEYAQHLPKYPERARALAAKAQRDAETALVVARQAHRRPEIPLAEQTER
jgi:hypothetical protein